jgi:hypothetical protein
LARQRHPPRVDLAARQRTTLTPRSCARDPAPASRR